MPEATAEGGADKGPAPGTPEYDAAMAAKFRDSKSTIEDSALKAFAEGEDAGTREQKPTKPDNVPDKFWDAEKGVVNTEALLKSYTELESNKGKAAADPATQDPVDPGQESDADKAAREAVEKAGLNWQDLGTKIASTGKLDDADYAALGKAGIPKDVADEFISLRQQAQDRATADAMAYIGGTKDAAKDAAASKELLEWAGKSLSKDQIEGYNTMLAGPNWKVAVDTLKTLRGQATGNGEPALLAPKTPASGGTVVGYKTQTEMQADMRDPKYFQQTPEGEKFRAQVQEKVRFAAWRQAA